MIKIFYLMSTFFSFFYVKWFDLYTDIYFEHWNDNIFKSSNKKEIWSQKKRQIFQKVPEKNKIMAPMMDFGSSEWKENELIHLF